MAHGHHFLKVSSGGVDQYIYSPENLFECQTNPRFDPNDFSIRKSGVLYKFKKSVSPSGNRYYTLRKSISLVATQ
jgi:hypothetical protein